MAPKTKEYHKLPGSKKGFLIGKYTLWQGADHLLQVYSRVGVEEYKRFYFNDIQAVITRKTAGGKIQNIVMGCLVLIFILPVIALDGGWSLFYGIVPAAMLLLLLVGLFKGPTCETKLMTAVQTEKLHSLHRLKNTFKVMDRLGIQIQRTQGTLKREELDNVSVRPMANQGSYRQVQQRTFKKISPRHETEKAHLVLFGLLLLDGVLVSLGFFFTHVVLTIISTVASLVMGIFVIVALVKQHDSSMSGSLKAITWASFGFICINFVAGYVISIVFAMQNPGIVYNQWEVFKSMSLLSPWESPLKLSFDIFTLCGVLFLGIPGLYMLYRSDSGLKAEATVTAVNYRKSAVLRNTGAG
jgi:hypothetical protein